LQPDRWKIAQANQLTRFQFFERKFQERLGRVKRVGAARGGVRFPFSETEMAFQHEQAFAHERDSVKAQQKSVDEIVSAANRFDLSHHPRGVKTLVRCAGENETFERL